MAEAPPNRKTTTYKDFEGMASENERYNVKPNEMFWLENIMRVAPHKLRSVPGPGPSTRFPVVIPCTDLTERGQQAIEITSAYNAEAFRPGNLRTSWGGIINKELYMLIGDATCGGGNMNYMNTGTPLSCCDIYHFTLDDNNNSLPTDDIQNLVPFFEDITIPAIAVGLFGGGQSDEMVFMLPHATGDSDAWEYIFPTSPTASTMVIAHWFHSPIQQLHVGMWCKHDTAIFIFDQVTGDNSALIGVYDRTTGTQVQVYGPYSPGYLYTQAGATNDFLYVHGELIPHGTGQHFVLKINRTTGAIDDKFGVDNLSVFQLIVASDELLYLICSGVAVYYIKNFSELIYVGNQLGASPSFGGNGCMWNSGTLYWGPNGFGGLGVLINKIVIACPPESGPVIAAVSVAESSVAAGNPVTVTFGPILLPGVQDKIQLAAAPTPPALGWNGATATQLSTGAVSSGTLSFSIPGGTTPGNYIIQLCTGPSSTIYIAKSNVFTVT